MTAQAFLDESKRRGLLLAASVVQPRGLGPARTALRRPCLPGQSRLHFTKERDELRRRILTVILGDRTLEHTGQPPQPVLPHPLAGEVIVRFPRAAQQALALVGSAVDAWWRHGP